MKTMNLIGIAVLVLVLQSVAWGEWWWPPGNVQISPQEPTCSDIIAITLSGEWPDGCIPNGSII